MNPGAGLLKGLWHIFSWVLRLVVVVLLIATVLLNTRPVTVNFLFDRHWEAPIALIMLLCLMGGVLLGGGAVLMAYWHHGRREPLSGNQDADADAPPALDESLGRSAPEIAEAHSFSSQH